MKFIVEDGKWSNSRFYGEEKAPSRAESSLFPADRFPRWLRGQCAVFDICTHILLPKEKHEVISLSRGISAAEHFMTL